MKRPTLRLWQTLFLIFLVVGSVLIIRQANNAPYQYHEGKIFGTYYHITYKNSDNLHADILKALDEVDNALSMFNEQSVISKVNNGQTLVDNSPEGKKFIDVVTTALDISQQTDGAFDITVAPLVNVWGFGFKHDQEPTPQTIDSLRQFVGYQKVSLKHTSSRYRIDKTDSRIMLDCSAIAKGYGCDVVAQLLSRRGVDNYMIEIGGEIVTHGVNKKGEKWKLGITEPEEDPTQENKKIEAILQANNIALATSGNYRNFYYKDGVKYAHTIDPRTGRPVAHTLLSATVIAPTCCQADAIATAFMVMGTDKAKAYLSRHNDVSAYLIFTDADGNTASWHSDAIDKLLP